MAGADLPPPRVLAGHDTGRASRARARIAAIERELARRDWLGYERARTRRRRRATRCTPCIRRRYVDAIEAAVRGGRRRDRRRHGRLAGLVRGRAARGRRRGRAGRRAAVGGGRRPASSLHRPPGHHAEPARAMGFCLFDNVAVAARHALDAHGLERVLILDWDVHHGNGTNDIFQRDRGCSSSRSTSRRSTRARARRATAGRRRHRLHAQPAGPGRDRGRGVRVARRARGGAADRAFDAAAACSSRPASTRTPTTRSPGAASPTPASRR